MNTYLTAAAGLMAAAVLSLAPSSAMARVDVDFNVMVPGIYVAPQPVYGQPHPVYVEPPPAYIPPRPVYVPPPRIYVQPEPVYVYPEPFYAERQYQRGRHHHWQKRHGREHHWREHAGRGQRDRDGDGVPNRYDRRPDNPYRY